MLISKGPGMSRDVPGLFSSKQARYIVPGLFRTKQSRHIDQTIPNYQNEMKHYKQSMKQHYKTEETEEN